MEIGIISDTHIIKDLYKLKVFLNTKLKNIDTLIHLGDYKSIKAYNFLKENKKLYGVYGNVDDKGIKDSITKKRIISLNGYRIGLFHGHGDKSTTIKRVLEEFKNEKVDIITFGHSHKPLLKTKKGILLLNPGSPFNKRREKWYTYIILKLEEDYIESKMKFYKN
ncbi:MAG: YfcE family phosphodiesterase [Firmicutes bacterium]|nr:YfcE family phosphodiesterase [Bacillota bacterium]